MARRGATRCGCSAGGRRGGIGSGARHGRQQPGPSATWRLGSELYHFSAPLLANHDLEQASLHLVASASMSTPGKLPSRRFSKRTCGSRPGRCRSFSAASSVGVPTNAADAGRSRQAVCFPTPPFERRRGGDGFVRDARLKPLARGQRWPTRRRAGEPSRTGVAAQAVDVVRGVWTSRRHMQPRLVNCRALAGLLSTGLLRLVTTARPCAGVRAWRCDGLFSFGVSHSACPLVLLNDTKDMIGSEHRCDRPWTH